MKTIEFRLAIDGLIFLIMILSGIWLSRKGKPYHKGIVALHKITALLAVVYTAILISHMLNGIQIPSVVWIAIIVTGILFILNLVSGALLTIEKPMPVSVLFIHRYTPILLIVLCLAALYMTIKLVA